MSTPIQLVNRDGTFEKGMRLLLYLKQQKISVSSLLRQIFIYGQVN